jgi:hypothetical protein
VSGEQLLFAGEKFMMRAAAAALALLVLAFAGALPARPPERPASDMVFVPDLGGGWEGAGWGTVALRPTADGRGYEGTYDGTYGKDVGRLSLSFSPRSGAFEGTWSEGKYRFGRLSVKVGRTGKSAAGHYNGDAKCEFEPGLPVRQEFVWKRRAR